MSVVNDGHAMIGNVIQVLIMAGLLGWSLFFILKRLAPNLVRTQQTHLANSFYSHGWQKIAQWLEPAVSSGGGCGSGCNTCGTCPSNPNKAAEEITEPVKWKNPTPPKSSGCH
jgi:hypothetical protein